MTAEEQARRWRERRVAQARRDVELETFPTTSGSQALLAHPMFGAGRGQSPQAPTVPDTELPGETITLTAGSHTDEPVEFNAQLAIPARYGFGDYTVPDGLPPTTLPGYYDLHLRPAGSGSAVVKLGATTIDTVAAGDRAAVPLGVLEIGTVPVVEASGTLTSVRATFQLVDRAPPPDGVFALAISTVVAGSFDNGATWQVIDDNWSTTAVIWTGDRFIAAGIDVILTSTDGTTWTVVQEPDFNPWIDGIATDGDGTIVIIDTNDEVYTSTDGGDSFTSYTLPNGPTSLSGAAYGNNTFVVAGAVSTPGRFWTSPDGTTWTERTTSLGQISGVEFGGGVFVAGGTGTDAYRSTDGITWTSHTAWGSNTTVQNVAYGNGRFLLLAVQGLIAWSDDGSSWTAGTTVGLMNTYDAVFDGSVWWAVGGEAFTQIITSSDNGETWTIVLASGDLDDFGGVGRSIALKP